jgi:ATP/maltotriose-dependent transcriptional regulator MalT
MRTLGQFASVAAEKDPSVLPEGEVHFSIGELFLGRLQSARRRLERLHRRDLRYFGSYGVRYLSDPKVLVASVLAQVQWLTGYPDTAAQTVAKAVELATQSMHHLTLNNILSYACPIFFWSGHFEECRRYVAMLAENVTRHGLIARRPVATFYQAALVCMQDDRSPDGVEGLRKAIEEFRDINHLARMPYYLSVLADALAVRGQIGDALKTIHAAIDVAREQAEDWCVPEVLRVHASILVAQGQTEHAEELLGRAMAHARQVGSPSWRLRAANDLAKLWCRTSREDDACAMLLPLMREFSEGFKTRDLLIASDILWSIDPSARETA